MTDLMVLDTTAEPVVVAATPEVPERVNESLEAELHDLAMQVNGMPCDDIDALVELAKFNVMVQSLSEFEMELECLAHLVLAECDCEAEYIGDVLKEIDASISRQRVLLDQIGQEHSLYKRALVLRAKLTLASVS